MGTVITIVVVVVAGGFTLVLMAGAVAGCILSSKISQEERERYGIEDEEAQ